MSILWKITIVEILLNLAVFSVAVILFGLIPFFMARVAPRFSWISDAAIGVLFGSATAAAMLLPIHFGGVSTGAESILLALSGLITGPVAGFLALTITVVAQLLSASDGVVAASALPATIGALIAGVLFRLLLGENNRENRETRVSYFHFPILGLVCSSMTLVALWAMDGWNAMQISAIPALIGGVLTCTVLGTILLHEARRNRAERELRESEARLAAQTTDLAEARDAAEQANRSKSAFLANMSHELRTPLNAILGFSQMIFEEYLGPVGVPKYKSYAGDIYASGEHLLSLINDLLDVAKIEAGKMELAPDILDAAKICEHVRMMMGIKARGKMQELSFFIRPGIPPLYADERALKQILINIVSNAIKYTPEGGKVAVTFEPDAGGGVRIACVDTGTGIPAEKLDKIFAPFSQVDNRFDRQAGGTGLGLSLVRGLAELHGGRVWLESEFGQGCKVYVVLPPKKGVGAVAA